VRLDGETASLGDWQIVCVLHHEHGQTRPQPCARISKPQLARLASARALCEACRTIRPRTKTFRLRDNSTGRTMQLGSSCLRAYTGAESPEAAVRRAESLADARAALTSASRTSSSPPEPAAKYIDTTEFIPHMRAIAENTRPARCAYKRRLFGP
jgi:hypothetical protein